MAKGKMVIFTAPASAETEGEFNRWYNNVHIPEIAAAAPKISGASRYKVSGTQIPGMETPAQPYMAMYHLDDVKEGIAQMLGGAAGYTATDSTSPEGGIATAVVYEQIFEFNKK
jgi:hypothetical protein